MPNIAVDAGYCAGAARLRDAGKTCYTSRGKFIVCFQGLATIERGLSGPHSRPGFQAARIKPM
jgi:hypothetical protein